MKLFLEPESSISLNEKDIKWLAKREIKQIKISFILKLFPF